MSDFKFIMVHAVNFWAEEVPAWLLKECWAGNEKLCPGGLERCTGHCGKLLIPHIEHPNRFQFEHFSFLVRIQGVVWPHDPLGKNQESWHSEEEDT